MNWIGSAICALDYPWSDRTLSKGAIRVILKKAYYNWAEIIIVSMKPVKNATNDIEEINLNYNKVSKPVQRDN